MLKLNGHLENTFRNNLFYINRYVTHIDWSLDSKYLHSNCGSYELLYWDIDSGKEFVKGTTSLRYFIDYNKIRDEKWETINTTMCWHT
jgi:microtubule-associated protein-like 6